MKQEVTHVSVFDCDHQPQGSQAKSAPTTEELLKDIRATMNYFIPRETVGRATGRIAGWYSTEQTYKW
jgi:hypothetical protein